MELFESFGITQTMLQGLILLVVATIFLGLYWRLIAAGAGILFVVFVFAYKPSVAKVNNVAPVEVTVPSTPEIKELTQEQKWHNEFMEDCLTVSENTKDQCETIWSERIEDEKHPEKMAVNWKKYKQYKARYL